MTQATKCKLCEYSIQNPNSPLSVGLWYASYPERKRDTVIEKVSEQLLKFSKDINFDITAEEALKHIRNHRSFKQPNPPAKLAQAFAENFYTQVDDENLETNPALDLRLSLLMFLSQVSYASAAQIRQWFFDNNPDIKNKKTAAAALSRTLSQMKHQFLIYRKFVESANSKKKESWVVYGLGRAGASVIDMLKQSYPDGHKSKTEYIYSTTELGTIHFPHDFGTINTLSLLNAHGLNNWTPIDNTRKLQFWIPPFNVYTDSYLGFSVPVGDLKDEHNVFHPAGFHTLFADAFAVAEAKTEKGKLLHIPFIYEHDTGSKDVPIVVEQLYAYLFVAKSRVLFGRFPELDVDNYNVPVVMATKAMAGGREKSMKRINNLRTQFLKVAEKRKLTKDIEGLKYTPIYTCLHEDLIVNGWNTKVYDMLKADDDGKYTLAQVMMISIKELFLKKIMFEESHRFKINRYAFRPAYKNKRQAEIFTVISKKEQKAKTEHKQKQDYKVKTALDLQKLAEVDRLKKVTELETRLKKIGEN